MSKNLVLIDVWEQKASNVLVINQPRSFDGRPQIPKLQENMLIDYTTVILKDYQLYSTRV
jgi:hypothetical protein